MNVLNKKSYKTMPINFVWLVKFIYSSELEVQLYFL